MAVCVICGKEVWRRKNCHSCQIKLDTVNRGGVVFNPTLEPRVCIGYDDGPDRVECGEVFKPRSHNAVRCLDCRFLHDAYRKKGGGKERDPDAPPMVSVIEAECHDLAMSMMLGGHRFAVNRRGR